MTMQLTERMQRELTELTSLPTAPACEAAVIEWVRRWVERRRDVRVKRDRFGNLLLRPAAQREVAGPPLIITAHMDHPAFVAAKASEGRTVTADFRGGVADDFFEGSAVRLWQHGEAVQTGQVTKLYPPTQNRPDKRVTVQLDRAHPVEPGDILTWKLPKATIREDRLHAPVCDDLVGVHAALHAFDRLRQDRGTQTRRPVDVRVLLTRCEEIGFVGALAACESGLVPKNARVVLLENSKSFAESPIGGGPIVRVGDKTSTFDPGLTYRLTQIAQRLAERDDEFQYQRRLMPGGTCEATAYHTRGRAATCLCLPLGHYHNMNERTGRPARETISLRDYQGLVRWLIEIGRHIDAPSAGPALSDRLDQLLSQRRHLIEA
jgi:endoglucanase